MEKCKYAKKCAGCQLQNLEYAEQLHMKQAKLISLLGRFAHVEEIIGMEDPLYYRNKVQRAFIYKDGRVRAGIYQSSSMHVIPVQNCALEDKLCQAIAETAAKLCARFKLHAHDLRTGKGYMRHILVRRGFASSQIMAVIVTAKGTFACKEEFTRALIEAHPEITTVVHNINSSKTPLMLGSYSEVLYGDGYIEDILCGTRFRISPKAFWQVNPVQTEILYNTAIKYAALTGKERVLDAYCGSGTITLVAAPHAKEICGVEVNPDAIKDAKENAVRNKIKNARFICADAGAFMRELADAGEMIDVVITDPPRAGCSREFLQSLVTLAPERVVYVSCNPETLARDLRYLTKNGYKAKKIQGVDMFPGTGHVETVVCLSKR